MYVYTWISQGMCWVQVRGKDIPKPVKNWNQCGLSSRVLEVLLKAGYAKPMPIQAQALPAIMSGRDCIGIAKTGSGKTLGFVLPMLRHIKDQVRRLCLVLLLPADARSADAHLCSTKVERAPCCMQSYQEGQKEMMSVWHHRPLMNDLHEPTIVSKCC